MLWKSEIKEKYKEKYREKYLRIVQENFVDGSGMYAIKTIRIDNGKKHGKYTRYHENGQICVDTTYQIICDKSQIHGKYIKYHKNGQICVDTTY
jgi:antitoxin component YwqK of YwqJK toxin-antitoxin module